MIVKTDIIAWGVNHPWPDLAQIEQDLLLSQAICVISNDPLLGDELALRGGTAFHKLFMPQPYRYSEDLDYIRISEGAIGPIMRRLTNLGKELGYNVSTKMGMYPKVFWRFTNINGLSGKIKIEINTYERLPMYGFVHIEHKTDSGYFTGEAAVKTLHVEELIATKIRALYQRSKGRDLYDIWLALDQLSMCPQKILTAFPAYRPENLSSEELIANLGEKMNDKQFTTDVANMIRHDAPEYDAQEACALVIQELLSRI